MSVYIDRKFLLLVSSRLERFAQKKDDLYNFRCPFCGDSRKNKSKARGYIFRKGNDYFYTCHNCNLGTSFSKFLNHIDAGTHKQYVMERYVSGENGSSNYVKPTFDNVKGLAFSKFSEKPKLSYLKNIAELDESHYAREYIQNRRLPESVWSEIFFTENYKQFIDTNFPEHSKDKIPEDDRIVLFYKNRNGDITNVSGRAIGESKIRYVTVKVSDEKKVFGLDRVNTNEKTYVFEGQFDSLFIPNSLASGDSNLCGIGDVLSKENIVLVYDNEPRNRELVKEIDRAIQSGFNICIFPDSLPGKDVNEMVLNGMTIEQIKNIIDENTVNDLQAKLRFVTWKKI